MAQVDGMLRRVLTLPRSASAAGYDEHVQCDDIASLSSETKRRKAAGVHRIVITGRPWQIGATFGATPGGHTRSSWGAERPYFTGLSRSHFKVAAEALAKVREDRRLWLRAFCHKRPHPQRRRQRYSPKCNCRSSNCREPLRR